MLGGGATIFSQIEPTTRRGFNATLQLIQSETAKIQANQDLAKRLAAEAAKMQQQFQYNVELEQAKAGGNSGGDGGTVDEKGNVYITSNMGLQVFDPSGKHLGTIRFPEQPSNATFGGKDMKTLYVTARTSVYSCPMEVAGHRYPGK